MLLGQEKCYNKVMPNLYNQTTKEVAALFDVDREAGLSTHEVDKRRAKYGKNRIDIEKTPLWKVLLEPFIDIFMLVLLAALVLSALQGNWIEAFTVAAIMVADAAIYYVQRFSTERILRSLQRELTQTVIVRRSGKEISIDTSELVPGDIVILHEGDRIPADGRILSESGLLSNESMLTGESEAIAKDAGALSGEKKVYEQTNMVFSGSFVITGSAEFIVTATGNNTEYGRIASLASNLGEESPIQVKMNRLVRQIALVVVGLAVVLLVIQLIDGISFLSALEFTLAMIVSAVPEGLPIAISIILALGAKRMAKKKALVRELQAIESIGVVTTIAADKTGTLTENRLALQEIWSADGQDDDLLCTLAAAALPETSLDENDRSVMNDPLDTSMLAYLRDKKAPLCRQEPVQSYTFDQSLKLSGNLYAEQNGNLRLVLKGAPETILMRSKLSNKKLMAAEEKLKELAESGYKVLALASVKISEPVNELEDLDKGIQFQFEGLFAVADALRKEAGPAIRQTAAMGVKTKMVTGDHADTAYAIGRELGLASSPAEVLDCSKLGNITDQDLANIVGGITIFARVTPEDKYRVLSAIKQTEVCAMTGDGVNDVPALVGAHVGIAMGDSPSIVQDAGDIILLDNNFKNVTEAIKESRTVLTNIRRMLSYLLATNAGEALTMIGALIFFGSQMLTPIQILWINIVTDSLMVIPIGLEPAERRIFKQKPEQKDAPILPGKVIRRMVVVAIVMAVFTLGAYGVSLQVLGSKEQANTLAFTALVVMQWASAFSARGLYESALARLKVPHRSFWLAMAGAIILQVLALSGPLMTIINTVAVPIWMILIVAVVCFFGSLAIFEVHKRRMGKG